MKNFLIASKIGEISQSSNVIAFLLVMSKLNITLLYTTRMYLVLKRKQNGIEKD